MYLKSQILTCPSLPEVAMYWPTLSHAIERTGPSWHSIFTSGVVKFGLHMVTVPGRWKCPLR
jgi:hypothetical protein